jgi:uncharacterized delta-60 repeat protein
MYGHALGPLFLACLVLAVAPRIKAQVVDSFNPGANSTVNTIVIPPDGKILVGGYFTVLGGESRNCLGRLNADGSLDAAFNAGTNFIANSVDALLVQEDGKLLVGGDFVTTQGTVGLARFFSDGTLDTNFTSGVAGEVADVYALSEQEDCHYLVGGYFTTLGAQPHTNIGRLNPDGKVDGNFTARAEVGVYSFASQTNHSIFVGGAFTSMNGEPHNAIARLLKDGQIDMSFNPAIEGIVFPLTLQTDGKLLVGGLVAGPDNRLTGLMRITQNGMVDSNFVVNVNSHASSIGLQSDGKILLAGHFTQVAGETRYGFARLNSDGSLDADMPIMLGTNSFATSVAIQPDGKILLGGAFNSVGGLPRKNLARLSNTSTATKNLTF